MSNPNARWLPYGNRIRCNQLFPRLEATPDINRGEIRLAAEFVLVTQRGETVPKIVRERASAILHTLASA